VDDASEQHPIRGRVFDMNDDIPPLHRPEDMPPVRTQADLHQHWRALMGQLGFSEPLLWFQFFDEDGRCTPVLQSVSDLTDTPDSEILDNLMWICHEVMSKLVPGGSVAFLLSRPGRAGVSPSDRTWATRLITAARDARVRCHPVHLANDDELRVFTADDAIAS
jgi:hypothetical protein